jgi:serine/threonine protein kinase
MADLGELQQYSLLKQVGRGAFGNVFVAKRKSDGVRCAIKILSHLEQASKVERAVMQTVTHPFIVSTHDSFIAKHRMHICMELVEGGTHAHRLATSGPIPLSQAKFYVAEIAMALKHLHDRGIVYRDLKPENVMIGLDGHIKLTDFGLSTEADRCYTTCGTPEYLAPEIITKKPYGKEADWWALGILFYEMLFRRTPFYAVDRARMNDKIVNRSVVVPQRGKSPEMVSFIFGLLDKDPRYRFGFEEVVKHQMMEDVNFSEIYDGKVAPEFKPVEYRPEAVNKAKSLGAKRESFQGGDGKVGQARSRGSLRASFISYCQFKHIKSLS